MFSHNDQISTRQMKSLLIMDWLAKLCLLFPILLSGRSLGTMVGCLAVGLLAWLWFSVLIERAAGDGGDFFCTAGRLGGPGIAWMVYLVAFFYFFAHVSVCMSLCANLAQTYLLPEAPVLLLVFLPLATGLYLAYSGVEVRGRVSELLAPIVLAFFLLMAAAAAFGMKLSADGGELLQADSRLFSGGYEVFAAIGGMFLPIMAGHLAGGGKTFGRSIRRAAGWSVILAGILLFVTVGSFGTRGMLAFRFPVIRVMSNVSVPGEFLQRWDVIFLSVLLFSLAVSVGSGFWYLNEITEKLQKEAASLWKKGKEEKNPAFGLYLLQGIVAFAAFCAAAGFQSAETAIVYYRAFGLYILTPVMIFLYLILYFRIRQRIAIAAASCVLVCLILTGCTARELEDRIFPMALEFRMDGEMPSVTFAWNEAGTSGAGEEAGAKDEESEPETGASGAGEEAGAKDEESEAETGASGAGEEAGAKDEESEPETAGLAPREEGNLTTFRGATLAEIRQQAGEYGDRYIDYSHVKAVIWDEALDGYPQLRREIYEWLAGEPAFAANLIIYPARESGLTLSEVDGRSDGNIGTYLENLYRNNQRIRKSAWTLGEMAREYYAEEAGET